MSDDPYAAARPSEGKGKTKTTVTFWAELWRPMEKNSHGESLVSPTFDTEAAAVTWIRAKRADYEQVHLWKRISRAGTDFDDIPLRTTDEPMPDPARLKAMLEELGRGLLVRRN